MRPESGAFYNLRDTSNSICAYYETVPLLKIIDNNLRDSIELIFQDAICQFDDSVKQSFILTLECGNDDSNHIYVFFRPITNISLGPLYHDRDTDYDWYDSWCPKNHRITIGCINMGIFYVFVITPEYFSNSPELETLFQEDKMQQICIHFFPGKEITWDDPKVVHVNKPGFTLEMHDKKNYISPRCDK